MKKLYQFGLLALCISLQAIPPKEKNEIKIEKIKGAAYFSIITGSERTTYYGANEKKSPISKKMFKKYSEEFDRVAWKTQTIIEIYNLHGTLLKKMLGFQNKKFLQPHQIKAILDESSKLTAIKEITSYSKKKRRKVKKYYDAQNHLLGKVYVYPDNQEKMDTQYAALKNAGVEISDYIKKTSSKGRLFNQAMSFLKNR